MRINLQNFRGVFHAAVAVACCAALSLALDLLNSIAGKNVAIGVSAVIVTVGIVCLILMWAGRGRGNE